MIDCDGQGEACVHGAADQASDVEMRVAAAGAAVQCTNAAAANTLRELYHEREGEGVLVG